MRKLTHEEFLKRLYDKNKHAQDIEILGTYIDRRTKILCKCKKCGYEWEVLPGSLLQGTGCIKCAGKRIAQKRAKTHEEFMEKFYEKNIHAQDIEVVGTYKSLNTEIECRCKKCEYEWQTTPSSLLQGSGCPKCAKNAKLTHEEFMEKFKKQNKHFNDIEVLGTYVTRNTKIKCKCKVCGHEWQAQPGNLLNGTGCTKCSLIERTKTHEQFIKELHIVNPDIEVLGTYINSQTKIKCKCKKDGYEWEAKPNDLLNGHGCRVCGYYIVSDKLAKTHEQFMQEFYEKNKYAQDIEILDTYINDSTKLKCKCKIDGYEWKVRAGSLLKGHGCPICGFKRTKENMTKTHEQFMEKFYEKNIHAQDIEILGTYINRAAKIKCKCKIDGHEWQSTPNSLLQGCGCPKCGGTGKLTHKQFIEKFKKQNKHAHDIEILGTYINMQTKIKCRCKIDGYEWETIPSVLLSNHGCPKCAIKIIREKQCDSHEEFLNKLYEKNIQAQNIEIIGTYYNRNTKILCRCKVCEHEWYTQPQILLMGSGCPKCNTSKGEKRIANYLDNLDIAYIYDKPYFKDLVSVKGRLLRPDFIIPSLKIWIEYDGEQHFNPTDFTGAMSEQQIQEQFKYIQENDQIKNQYAKDNNWTLIRIPFTEYDNIEQILAEYIEQEEQVI